VENSLVTSLTPSPFTTATRGPPVIGSNTLATRAAGELSVGKTLSGAPSSTMTPLLNKLTWEGKILSPKKSGIEKKHTVF
jgi:hypothetical protein